MAEPEVSPRYDRLAEGYARHWGPVIRPAAVALLDRLDDAVSDHPKVLDVGTGTGTLAAALLTRWPSAEVVGVDPSPAMLELALASVPAAHDRGAPGFTSVTSFAD